MKSATSGMLAGLYFILITALVPLNAGILFQDGFESGTLSSEWVAAGTGDGRTQVSSDFGPQEGTKHLVLDDAVTDANSSVAEATLTLNLSFKKNVVLTFQAKSLGNEAHAPPTGTNFTGTRIFDAVTISTDGGTTWRTVANLSTLSSNWQQFSIPLDTSVTSLGGTFGANFKIRFSQYDNAPAPIDGIAIDAVSVDGDGDQRVALELPTPLLEGTGPHTGFALLAFAPSSDLTVNLSTSPAGQLSVPASVTVSAGQAWVSFPFSVVNDSLVNLTRAITVNGSAAGATSSSAAVSIVDDDAPVLNLVVPSTLTEGVSASNNATISTDRAPTVALTVTLSQSPPGELSFPTSVTIPANQTQALFTVTATNDTKIDGDVPVVVTASTSGSTPVTAATMAVDNETRTLNLNLPATISEGGTATGTVSIPGTLTSTLSVLLASGNETALTVPASVLIPAGSTSATFTLTAPDNSSQDGSKTVAIQATAATFTPSNKTTVVRDNEVAAYRFATLADIVNVGSTVSATITALDIEGNTLTGFAGSVNLSLKLPNGTTQAVTPAMATFANSTWTGSITLPPVSATPLQLRAQDASGRSGESNAFDTMRVVSLTAADMVWDASRSKLYASVPNSAGGTYANQVVVIDPVTGQITPGVTLATDPKKLAITSDGQFLYAALQGNGSVSRIALSTMTVGQSFLIGASQYYGTLYVEDMCTVAGQPNLLVVSQFRSGVSPRHDGVAVYDNGLKRTAETQDHTGSNVIEPSADPTIFFGYNNETTEFGFRTLKLNADGMTELQVNGSLMTGFSSDMKSDGDLVCSLAGDAINGAQMRRLGSFGTSGPVCPDLASNRVFFVEPQSQYSSNYDKIAAFDVTSRTVIRRLTSGTVFTSPAGLIRWGSNGLAFRTGSSIVILNSSQLVPSAPPADLAISIQATPNPAAVSQPLTYTVQITNHGPNPSDSTILNAVLSDSQTLQSAAVSQGTTSTTGTIVNSTIGTLASGASATLTITTLPQSAGSLTCQVGTSSLAIDPAFANNTATKLVSVGFQSAPNSVNQLRLAANNLVYDSTRNLLWAAIPSTDTSGLAKTLISINPVSGLMSDPIPVGNNPTSRSLSISKNGRFLYLGLSDSPEAHRVDLNNANATLRIPMGTSQWGDANYAGDFEALDGDGTSFLVVGTNDHSAYVFDGLTRRTSKTAIYSVDRIESVGLSNLFVGYNNYTSGYDLSRLSITTSGVSVAQSIGSVISGYNVDIRGDNGMILSSSGKLVNSSDLSLKTTFAFSGRPCLDAAYQRAFLLNGNQLLSYDSNTYLSTGNFTLPVSSTGDWAQTCIRWGLDGFAILGNDGKVYIARWTGAVPPTLDSDADGMSDAWEIASFGAVSGTGGQDGDMDGMNDCFEFLFGTNPAQPNSQSVSVDRVSVNDTTGIRIAFPRRAGVSPKPYVIETSCDLAIWTPANNAVETISSSRITNGVTIESVEAVVPMPAPDCGFVRLRWLASGN